MDLEKQLAAAEGATEKAVAAALADASEGSEKALAESAKRVKALEDALAAAGDLFQNEKREALEDLTQKHESVLAETERKVGKARADAESSQKALEAAQAKHSEALDDAAVAQEEAVATALSKAAEEHAVTSAQKVAEAVTKANDDAATARAALTQSLQAAQTKALEEQADSLQEAHEASTRKMEAVHEEALAAQKRDAEALSSKIDRADAARKSLEAKCNDLEARLKQAADAHARPQSDAGRSGTAPPRGQGGRGPPGEVGRLVGTGSAKSGARPARRRPADQRTRSRARHRTAAGAVGSRAPAPAS